MKIRLAANSLIKRHYIHSNKTIEKKMQPVILCVDRDIVLFVSVFTRKATPNFNGR